LKEMELTHVTMR